VTNIARSNPMGTALAGSVIAAALLETLFDKEILTLIEARTVLDSAMHGLAPVAQSPEGFAAAQIIGALQKGKFSARG
jgi:hypothetical protein